MPKNLKSFNGDKEALSQYYRDLQKKSRKTYSGEGGFKYLKKHNPDKLKAISDKGNEAIQERIRGGKSQKPVQTSVPEEEKET